MFDLCTVLAVRADRLAEVRARKAAIEARRATRSSGPRTPGGAPLNAP